MKQELGYTCPQTKKQCDDECCVSAEDCHAKAINNIISNCEPEQLNQNNMEQTAVEWLVSQLNKQGFAQVVTDEEINQSKEMEKQQIVDAYRMGRYDCDKIVMSEKFYAEQYYNETFKTE